MEINRINSLSSPPAYSGANKAETAQIVSPKAQNGSKSLSLGQDKQVKDLQKTEQQRLDTVMQGATEFKDVYAVSDSKFTIFKDSTGQFVTRFTSLKDGAVTYLPEPDVARFVESNKARTDSLVKIEV